MPGPTVGITVEFTYPPSHHQASVLLGIAEVGAQKQLSDVIGGTYGLPS